MNVPNPLVAVTFIDTNVWLYAFTTTQDPLKMRRAKAVLRQTPNIALSTQVINEVSYNLLRKFKAEEHDIKRLINSLYRRYIVNEFSKSVLQQALELRVVYKLSFWDSLIVASALDVRATTLLSEDMHDGLEVNNQLIIRNPFVISSTP